MFKRLRAMLGRDESDTEDDDIDDVSVVEVRSAAGRKQPPAGPKASAKPASPPPAAARPSPEGEEEDTLLAGELRAAQKIQMGLVPKTFPPIPGCLPFDLYAILEPAREIGGDFYDFWLNGRENLVLVIGDVSGKGIPAALFMAVCRTYLRAFSRSVKEPAKLVEYLNNEVSRHNETCMFVTLICAMVHLPTGRMTYANAGHNPPFLRKRNGSVSQLDIAEDMPVGFMSGTEFATKTINLETGDSILFYTDGMPEAFNDERDILGDEESLDLFKSSSAGGSCRTAVGQLRAEISEFANGAEQSDDITLMMYGQLEQGNALNLTSDREFEDPLAGDQGVFSLSNLNDALPSPGAARFDADLGLSLSGFSEDRR